jgi:regulatory protein
MAFASIRRGASGNGFFAVPEDGSSFFIPSTQFVLLGLSLGQDLTEEEFNTLHEAMLRVRCREKALAALAMREHSFQELKVKLIQKDFPQEIVQDVLQRLSDEHLLSDRRFAVQFVEVRQRKNPEGRFLLQSRLMDKGVPRDLVSEILDAWFEDEAAVDDAVLHAARKLARKHMENDELVHALRKKGFTIAEIRRALKQEE